MTWTLDEIIGLYFMTLLIGFVIVGIGWIIIVTWPNNNVAILLGASICVIGAIIAAARL